jgi:hypothetical protein
MTLLRKHRDAISNYFNTLTEGLGKRGSSFMDVDAVSHDKDTRRFLFQEFKEPDEPLHPAQEMVLRDLAGLPACTVWFVRRLPGRRIGWIDYRQGKPCLEEILTEQEYRDRFIQWWSNGAQPVAPVKAPIPTKPVAAPFGYDITGSPLAVAPGTSKNIPRDGDPAPKLLTADDINWGFR